MRTAIEIGTDGAGKPVLIDVEELLATRLLVQGNSGSGKSHLLRRMLEESADLVQQIIIDPEGDFATLADAHSHMVIDGGDYNEREIATIGARVREHRASVVLKLESLELEAQMICAAGFLNALFDAPRDHWYPALVVVDEAQMFAPAVAGDVSDIARRASLGAMTNLMCRGRKRGLAGAIATQRLAKLAKNVAAEASNFLMGRTFLDIDMARAADLLGMERRQAETIRDLERGSFLGLGPAISRRPISVKIGPTKTSTRMGTHSLMPMPSAAPDNMRTMLFAEMEADAPPTQTDPRPRAVEAEELVRQMAAPAACQAVSIQSETSDGPVAPEWNTPDADALERIIVTALEEMLTQEDCAFQSDSTLYQDFTVRCRMQRLSGAPLALADFRKRFALAKGGILDPSEPRWQAVLEEAARLPEDMAAPFLLIARAAIEEAPCPDDAALGLAYGTSSPGRVRRLIEYMEKQGAVVLREDFGGRRSIGIPGLGLSTLSE
ncbi:DUF87 domain-containing protein [Altererythrobacter confluentis]|uniref:DUF87 domain-containing protein n=1 Tax=Allopontixanthobacter confluentis TaxID=1849021 RepID=A0A6L7GBD6_9SPHN|nr:DUF87 domain-containing protein [Allopontixanthobacter confluentis]